MLKKAFTLIELVFTIVIIGVLAAVAVPKFAGLSDNAKVAAELSTAASVQVALDSCHGEWIINEGTFTCGGDIASGDLNDDGYPKVGELGSDSNPLNKILKNADGIGWTLDSGKYYGPASDSSKGASDCKANKPCIGKYWDYNETAGIFKLIES